MFQVIDGDWFKNLLSEREKWEHLDSSTIVIVVERVSETGIGHFYSPSFNPTRKYKGLLSKS